MTIEVSNTANLPCIDYRSLLGIQGKLKDLNKKSYNKLKNSLLLNGFFVPFFVWIAKEDEDVIIEAQDAHIKAGGHYILDGHQRLNLLIKEKVKPFELPYLEIEAHSFHDAKKKLLAISSQYGKITQEGVDEFAFDIPLEYLEDVINFDALYQYDVLEEEEEEIEEQNEESDDEKTSIKITFDSRRDAQTVTNFLKTKDNDLGKALLKLATKNKAKKNGE